MLPMPGASRQAVREHDVDREERGIREGECDPDGLACEPHVGEQVHARDGEREREGVPARPRAGRREHDDGEELDRRDRPERQPVDRDVEADVHRGEDERELDHGSPGRLVPRRGTRARAGARARRSRRRWRCGARPRPAARRGRRGARRTPARGSGRRRFRRSRRCAGGDTRARASAPRGADGAATSISTWSTPACHSGMANRRTWRDIAS